MKPESFENILSKPYVVCSILLLVCSLRFVNLGFGEIQEWDEALYAVRARSIVHFGDWPTTNLAGWLDQTNHAVGGLYSASHPPLFIWLTAVTYEIFGISNFTTRLWSAVFSCGIIVFVYLIGKRLLSQAAGLLAAVLIGTIPIFTFYSRQGQLDTTFLFFLTGSVCLWLLFLEADKSKWLILSAISFGLSLASKSASGILTIPIIIAVSILYERSHAHVKIKVWLAHLIHAIAGLLIVLPWYIYMERQPHPELSNGFLVSQVLGSIQGVASGLGTNVKELGYFYFPNQLLVRFALSGLAFATMLLVLVKWIQKRKPSNKSYRPDLIASIWFLTVLLVYSILRTKVISYVLPMLIPLSLLSALALGRLRRGEFGRIASITLLGIVGVSLVWSLSDEARGYLKGLFNLAPSIGPNSTLYLSLLGSLALSVVILALLIVVSESDSVRARVLQYLPSVVIVTSIVVLLWQVFFVRKSDFTDGAEALAQKVNASRYDQIVYLHTPHYTGGMNPQLAYYLDGINCGWQPGKRFIEFSRTRSDSLTVFVDSQFDMEKSYIIIEKNYADQPEKSEELIKAERIASSHFDKLLETKRYILYLSQQISHGKA
jgi:4-amino-4-deoxy-L-arabinose transferase-like glycosyltransferase